MTRSERTDILSQTDRGVSLIKTDIDSGDWRLGTHKQRDRQGAVLAHWGAQMARWQRTNRETSSPPPPPPPPPPTELQMQTEKAYISADFHATVKSGKIRPSLVGVCTSVPVVNIKY